MMFCAKANVLNDLHCVEHHPHSPSFTFVSALHTITRYKMKSPHVVTHSGTIKVQDMAAYQGNIYAYGHCGWSRRVHELAMMKTVVFMEHSMCREYVILLPTLHCRPLPQHHYSHRLAPCYSHKTTVLISSNQPDTQISCHFISLELSRQSHRFYV